MPANLSKSLMASRTIITPHSPPNPEDVAEFQSRISIVSNPNPVGLTISHTNGVLHVWDGDVYLFSTTNVEAVFIAIMAERALPSLLGRTGMEMREAEPLPPLVESAPVATPSVAARIAALKEAANEKLSHGPSGTPGSGTDQSQMSSNGPVKTIGLENDSGTQAV